MRDLAASPRLAMSLPSLPAARRLALALASLALTACTTVGPDARPPAPRLPAAFSQAPKALPAEAAALARFWRGFGDPVLDGLVAQALAANPELRLAVARLQESRALLLEADTADRPGLGVEAGASRAVTPSTQARGLSREARTGNTLRAGFVASWELDFFGGLARGREAARAGVSAEEAGLQAVRVSVVAEVARLYLELRGLQQRQDALRAALDAQRESLRLLEARAAAGRATALDLARARGLLAATEASLPALQAGVARNAFRLATLAGQPHGELLAALESARPGLPSLPVTDLGQLPVGTPAQWLARRPDVAATERQLAAATARIGVAQAELYPKISLSGLLGLNAPSWGQLGRGAAGVYSLGAALQWTPFDRGTLRARVAGAEARSAQALVRHEQAVAAALEDTETAFSDFSRSAERAARLDEATRQNDEALRLASLRFEAGVVDFLAVLDARRQAQESREAWVQAQSATATALVAVYRSLGGGWDAQPASAPTAAR